MTKGQRKLLYRISGLGLLLTLLVVGADGLGWLDPLEQNIYDSRAKHFQFFTPPPSRDVVHIDIDDPSIDEIGRWPWHRTVLARLIDETRLAGAKVIALDIIFYEPEDPQLVQASDKTIQRIDHDANLASSFARAGNVLAPVSVAFEKETEPSPIYASMVKLLEEDPELSLQELKAKLAAAGFKQRNLEALIQSDKIDVSKQAMFNRLERELSVRMMSADDVRKIILPRTWAADVRTDAAVLLYKTYPSVLSLLSLRRFGQEPNDSLRDVLHGEPNTATIAQLCDPARFTGFVDILNARDGVVRSLPICANYRGKIFPHMVLATACAQLGVDPMDVKYAEDRVTIPVPGKSPIVIPVRSIASRNLGRTSMFMDIPWFGPANYTRMFDAPAYAEPRQRIPMRNIYDIIQLQRSMQMNDEAADAAILQLLETIFSQADYKEYVQVPSEKRAELRKAKTAELLEYIKPIYDEYSKLSDADLQKLPRAEQLAVPSYRALLSLRDKTEYLNGQINAKRAALRKELEGRAAMIGWTVTGGTDRYPTSVHPVCPGVSIMSTAVSGILTRDLWRALPWWIAAVVTLVMGMTTTFLVARLSPVPALLWSAALFAGYGLFNALFLFDSRNLILPAAGTVTAVAFCWSGLTLARFIIESRERRRITQRFSNYVDPSLVDYFIENPDQMQLDGKVREMTVVFTDLAGFTTISEKLREKTVPILNEYMSLMVPIIREHSGYWDKFLGDGIMFFYNGLAPLSDHAIRAIDTAMEMQVVTQRFNARLRERQLPNVAMRAGISTGEMVVGDAGSKDAVHRANNFTVLGDAVNLGARLEGANKPIGTKILINGRTAELSEGKFLLRPIGNVRVVGKLEGVQLFEPLCRVETATDEQKKLVEFATTIVEAFADADFEKCICVAKTMEGTLGSTKFSQFYMRIAKEHLENPSTDFEGQIVLSEK